MLPPQLRQPRVLALKTTSTSLMRASQSRALWGWHRPNDWTSHLDPLYRRFRWKRTLKTRAQLIKDLRRRGKFDWDFDSRPFFTSRRCASHWDGNGNSRRRGWYLNDEPANGKEREAEAEKVEAEEDGYELNTKEKLWKQRMETMRKRIERDPYEAIFGKRFEPFWSPLVPSWMREEMGLQGWPKANQTAKPASSESATKPSAEKSKTADSEQVQKDILTESKAQSEKKTTEQPTSYSYASSTSWDSWTNKTRRVEWDSVSGQTRKYEYDPISNRMVAVEAPKTESATESAAEVKDAEQESAAKAKETAPATSATEQSSETKAEVTSNSDGGVDIPVKRFKVPPLCHASHGFSISQFTRPTALGPWKSTAVSEHTVRAGPLANREPEKRDSAEVSKQAGKELPVENVEVTGQNEDVESLTAQDVRASIGSGKKTEVNKKPAVDSLEKTLRTTEETVKPLIERDPSLKEKWRLFRKDHEDLQSIRERYQDPIHGVEDKTMDLPARFEGAKTTLNPALQTSVERMQSKNLPLKAPSEVEEPDDSAAHESTEPIPQAMSSSVPKNWDQQADMLQADRIRRTRGVSPIISPSSNLQDMEERTKDLGAKREKLDDKLKRANEMLQAEVREQKVRMEGREEVEGLERLRRLRANEQAPVHHIDTSQRFRQLANENAKKYADKIRDLNVKLEEAYKQSALHSQKHMERIKDLEQQLAADKQADGKVLEKKYAEKIKNLKIELERAYKQSAVHSEKHLERIKWLEGAVERTEKGHETVSAAPARPEPAKFKKDIEKTLQKARDAALVREVREIYESEYGVIDAQHRQPSPVETTKKTQVVEVESDVDLGEALAKYENEKEEDYKFKKVDAVQEQTSAVHKVGEAAQSAAKDTSRSFSSSLHRSSLWTNDGIPLENVEFNQATKPTAAAGIEWQHPPLYKVLVYDSGNDVISTATTTSNFTPTESPITIQKALSELYSPAKFVPHLAELQKDGYQVIYGTKDLLVFKKVAVAKVPAVAESEPRLGLEDHGLVSEQRPVTEPTTNTEKAKTGIQINPIDGTLMAEPFEPQTGSFASPTGFVNHDPVSLPGEQSYTSAAEAGVSVEQQPRKDQEFEPSWEDADADITWRHYPRVRREEPHFTGTKRAHSLKGVRSCYLRRHQRRSEERFRRKRMGTFKRILLFGAGTAGVIYLVGSAAEKSRTSKDREWERKAAEMRKKVEEKSKSAGWW